MNNKFKNADYSIELLKYAYREPLDKEVRDAIEFEIEKGNIELMEFILELRKVKILKKFKNSNEHHDWVGNLEKQFLQKYLTDEVKINSVPSKQKNINFRIAFNSISKKVTSELIQTAEYLNDVLVRTFNTPNQSMIIPLSQMRSGKVNRKRIPNTSVDFQGGFTLFKDILEKCFSTLETQNEIIIEFENKTKITLLTVNHISNNAQLEEAFNISNVFQIKINLN